MLAIRVFTLAVLLVIPLGGCGAFNSTFKYDALKDETEGSQYIKLGNVLGYDGGTLGHHIYVSLSGKSKHPTKWKAYLHLQLVVPKDAPYVLVKGRDNQPETVMVMLGSSAFETIMMTKNMEHPPGYREDELTLATRPWDGPSGFTIDHLASLAQGDRLTIDGKEISIPENARQQIRDLVVAAREVSNSG